MQNTLRSIDKAAGHVAVLVRLEVGKQSARDSVECDIVKLSDFYKKIEEVATFGDEWPVIDGKPLATECDTFNRLSESEKQNAVNPQIKAVELVNQESKLIINEFHDICRCPDVQNALENRVKKPPDEFKTILLCKDIAGRTSIPEGADVFLAELDLVPYDKDIASDSVIDIPLRLWSDVNEPIMSEKDKNDQGGSATLQDVVDAIKYSSKTHTESSDKNSKIMENIAEALANFSKHEKHIEKLTGDFATTTESAKTTFEETSGFFKSYTENAANQRAEMDSRTRKYFWGSMAVGGSGLLASLFFGVSSYFNNIRTSEDIAAIKTVTVSLTENSKKQDQLIEDIKDIAVSLNKNSEKQDQLIERLIVGNKDDAVEKTPEP